MKIRRILASVFGLSCAVLLTASSIDSLYQKVNHSLRPDHKDVNQLMLLLDANGITDSLVQYNRRSDRNVMMASTHLYMAAYYYELTADMSATMQAARKAEFVAWQAGDTLSIEEALAYQAVAASRMGQIDVALEATRKELRLDSLTRNLPNLSRAYNTLAGLSLQAGRQEDAKAYIRKAIDMERALADSAHLSVRYGVAAEIFAKAGEPQLALDYAQRAYAIDRAAGDCVKVARRLSQMADIYSDLGDAAQAEQLYLRSIDSLRVVGELKSLAINLKQLGQLYSRRNRLSEARKVLDECEAICRQTNNRYTLQQACRLLAELWRDASPQRALEYMQEALVLSDSLHSQRAEQLADELRRSQANVLTDVPEAEKAASGSPLRTFVLLIVAAAAGLVVGRCWRKKEKEPIECAEEQDSNKSATSADSSTPTAAAKSKSQDIEFLARVSELYEQHLGRQRLGIDELASEMCMSRSQFTRRIMSATGMGANNYFTRPRMEKACRLLKGTEKSIGIIAEECGFDDPSYFSNIFKKTYGVTPMQYRVMPLVNG